MRLESFMRITHAYVMRSGSYLLLGANKITSLQKAFQRPSKVANQMHSCDAVRTLVWPASCGIHVSSGNSLLSMLRRSGSNINRHRREGGYG